MRKCFDPDCRGFGSSTFPLPSGIVENIIQDGCVSYKSFLGQEANGREAEFSKMLVEESPEKAWASGILANVRQVDDQLPKRVRVEHGGA